MKSRRSELCPVTHTEPLKDGHLELPFDGLAYLALNWSLTATIIPRTLCVVTTARDADCARDFILTLLDELDEPHTGVNFVFVSGVS